MRRELHCVYYDSKSNLHLRTKRSYSIRDFNLNIFHIIPILILANNLDIAIFYWNREKNMASFVVQWFHLICRRFYFQ